MLSQLKKNDRKALIRFYIYQSGACAVVVVVVVKD